MAKPKSGLIAALDIGTTKVCCFVAQAAGDGNIRVIGIGHQKAHGLRAGAIVDMDVAEESIRGAVHAAEQMAGETIREVFVNLSCGAPLSQTVAVEVSIAGHEVGDTDLRRALGQGYLYNESSDREIIHSIPVNYVIDGSPRIRDPRGMYGDRLGVNMHVVSANAGPVRNLKTCVARCHLDLQALAVSSYAAGLSALVEDETDLGVTCIDMGGGTTSIAVFLEGEVVYTECIPIGGQHVTSDIARGLSTPLVHAERMKTLYGSTLATSADEHDVIDVPQVGEDEHAIPNHVPKSILVGIIQPRLEETFELVRSAPRGGRPRQGRRAPRGADRRGEPAAERARARGPRPRQAGAHGQTAQDRGPRGRDGGPGVRHLCRAPAIRGDALLGVPAPGAPRARDAQRHAGTLRNLAEGKLMNMSGCAAAAGVSASEARNSAAVTDR